MNNRFLLYVAFSLVLFMVWQQWKIEQSPVSSPDVASQAKDRTDTFADMPEEALRNSAPSSEQKQEQRKSNY